VDEKMPHRSDTQKNQECVDDKRKINPKINKKHHYSAGLACHFG
jgi:hypothetical protein